jgi:tetratricopeptide (TPR) repeat protein
MDQMSPQELFIAGERCLHARRDEMAFSFLEKAIKNLKGNELSDITHEKQIFVFSKLLSRQVKSGHLVARSLSQAFRAQARAIKHENAEKAYAALQKQQRVADKYDLVVEKAYGAESLGVAICILRLGCDISRQPEYSLVLPSSGNAEQVLILNTKLFDRADLSLWLMAQEAPPLNTTGFSRKDVNMKNILKESSSVATNTMPFGPIIADSRIFDRSNTESACSEAIGYFDFMLKVARKYNKYGMQRDAHQLLSQCYLIRNEHHLALMHAKIFDDMSRDNELQRIVSLQQLGRVHLEFGEFDAATETWKILLDQCNQSKRTEPQVPQRHRIRQHVRKESRKLMNPCTHLASTYCFLGKTHFLAGDYYAALEDFRSQLKFAHNELCIIVAELNIAFTLRSLGEPQQLKSALALYNKYLSWSMAEKTRDNFHTKDPGNRVLTSMETHARFCLSEIHTALGETSTALVNQKKLGSLTCLHGDINTLGEIYARRAIGELMSVNLQPSSLLDDSDDEI